MKSSSPVAREQVRGFTGWCLGSHPVFLFLYSSFRLKVGSSFGSRPGTTLAIACSGSKAPPQGKDGKGMKRPAASALGAFAVGGVRVKVAGADVAGSLAWTSPCSSKFALLRTRAHGMCLGPLFGFCLLGQPAALVRPHATGQERGTDVSTTASQ